MLAVSGSLDQTVGGSLMTVMNRTYANGGNAPADVAKHLRYDAPRWMLYLQVVRTALCDFLAAFDYPDPGLLTGQRASTTVAPQALFVMNSPFVRARAAAFADRVRAAAGDDAGRVRAAYAVALGRPAADGEVAAAVAFLDRDEAELRSAKVADPRAAAWARLCHALLASNEFAYLR